MEDAFIITGGKKLIGEVLLSGAKNVSLKVIIASLLYNTEVMLKNVPKITDVVELLDLIKELGGRAEFIEKNTVVIDGKNLKKNRVDLLHASKIRVSFMLFAPLLYKFMSCYVPNPGGCRIGARPIDRIVEGMKKLGVKIDYDSETGYYDARMSQKPTGSYRFQKPSHTGTELLILLSVFGRDRITLENCAREPEIDELIRFLNAGGARIKRDGSRITIDSVTHLRSVSPFAITSDRNEAVTFATLAILTKGDVTIGAADTSHLESFIKEMKGVGAGVEKINDKTLRFYYSGPLRSSQIETSPHPGFMTDWQPNWAVLMTQAAGESVIHERVFENRFSYVEELRKLGAEIDYVKVPVRDPTEYFFFNFDSGKKYNQAIRIKGPQTLHGGVLNVSDLRAGATLVLAALIAQDESVVNGASIIERGYENIVNKIKELGGEIEKM
ncbi:UDP-N-acetylglucosamine 1-carboxyvinyltransferase [Candidatus Roizmanbacteria bacterium RIFCSPHIGHO2_01_FULL_39_8]|uniref:UDP-N-acetylglucosamine 1-carboxyvinyltransferase n=2 Tax=Candidatus Roizmaniibacteriota TaxID=1752723 RepID=A0A1F7GSE3_9BACT|nr:MAG: UDP-N-acetylglucosamine 1-carboxyvinyltransferase [Candidatus Roizmanbacteria bacterium RIFCSPHIGHO2_01_FULL_39_8]OGK28081.1 MAG: UDP-N-acetylglucosamine 1-carboxyvinyltransferase [Candidatus Roizmanbacteria bacterium RIFCSPHIGHO2_02_FULL_39_9]